MKALQNSFRGNLVILFATFLFLTFSSSCNNGNDSRDSGDTSYKAGEVEVVSQSMNLNLKDTVPPGWTTFIFKNQSPNTHFFVLEKYPEGKTLDSAKKYVIPVFDAAMDSIMAGNSKAGMAEFANLPAWYSEVRLLGGAGLTAPGTTTKTTFKLDTGYYVIECYVKMPNGKFHSSMGMFADLTVTGNDNGATEPDATDTIEISSDKGIVFPGKLDAGQHIFAVNFKDQKAHENFVGHDLHLVRLDEDYDVNQLNDWMDWMNPQGLVSPTPKGMEFLGGTQEMPAGSTAYFTADLKPGRYAFVSEVTNPAQNNMLKTFTIEGNTDTD